MCCVGERGFSIKRKVPSIRSKEVTYRLCRALKDCLCVNQVLTSIELQGIPLRETDIALLAKVCVLIISRDVTKPRKICIRRIRIS